MKLDIDLVHKLLSREDFKRQEPFILNIISNKQYMIIFIKRMFNFTKWQVYRNYPGNTNTNSNLES